MLFISDLPGVLRGGGAVSLSVTPLNVLGPHDLALSTTLAQLKAFASSVMGYPCNSLCLCEPQKDGSFTKRTSCCKFTRTSLVELNKMGEKFVIKNPDGRVQRVCCIVEGPSECKKCGIPNTLGYARDQGYLPRFGKYGSFDNYGGTIQYILACQGNRRQCGAC